MQHLKLLRWPEYSCAVSVRTAPSILKILSSSRIMSEAANQSGTQACRI
jgi:hypothetical protein